MIGAGAAGLVGGMLLGEMIEGEENKRGEEQAYERGFEERGYDDQRNEYQQEQFPQEQFQQQEQFPQEQFQQQQFQQQEFQQQEYQQSEYDRGGDFSGGDYANNGGRRRFLLSHCVKPADLPGSPLNIKVLIRRRGGDQESPPRRHFHPRQPLLTPYRVDASPCTYHEVSASPGVSQRKGATSF